MKVNRVEFYLDGGTAKIETDCGLWYCDRRLFTETKNRIYDRYPDEFGATIINEYTFIKDMVCALKEHIEENLGEKRFHPEGIKSLIKDIIETN